jgi:1-acyl-sn-glycerol-3-phosphate acyltransferase
MQQVLPLTASDQAGSAIPVARFRHRKLGRHLAEFAMTALARLLVRVFFRQVELQNGDSLPAAGPVVLVANHVNGLVDALLLMATLHRFPRFLGKSTLFKIVPLKPFLKLGGVIPVYRAIDGDPGDHNVSAFVACSDILARGGVVAVFPEGISHDESRLQPLRTGAARIALEAGVDRGIENVTIVAVGLTYDAKARFRSRALVRVGAPARVSSWEDSYRHDDHEAVRALTDEVAAKLGRVSPSYASWSRADVLSRIAEIVVRQPQGQFPSDVALVDQVMAAGQLAQSEEGNAGSLRLDHLVNEFEHYQRDLDLLGLSDSQVAAKYPVGRLRESLTWALLKIAVALPFAAIGLAVHLVPFQIMKQVAKKPPNEGIKATVKLLGCAVLFASVYVALGVVGSQLFGATIGILTALGAPVCGYAMVRLAERIKRVGGVVEGYRTIKSRGPILDIVFADREKVVQAASAVLHAQ